MTRDLFGNVTTTREIDGDEYAVEVLRGETLDAIRIQTADTDGVVIETWLPKSQIHIRPLNAPHAMVTIPDWLARKKGLIE